MGYSLHKVQSPTWGWLGCSRARACCPSTCLLVTKFSKLPRNRAHTVSGILLRCGLHRSAWGCELQLLSLWGAPGRQWARHACGKHFLYSQPFLWNLNPFPKLSLDRWSPSSIRVLQISMLFQAMGCWKFGVIYQSMHFYLFTFCVMFSCKFERCSQDLAIHGYLAWWIVNLKCLGR